jgi:hypothetical protein
MVFQVMKVEIKSMRMDEEGEIDPIIPIGSKLHFHMQIDERISNNFSSKHSFLILYPHNHDSFHKFRGAKARLGSLRLSRQHLYDTAGISSHPPY